MGFCTLCISIPLETLPPLPSKWAEGMFTRGRTALNEFSLRDREDQRLLLKETFGFRHHSSFKALATSAESCELCALMNESITSLATAYESTETYPDLKLRLSEHDKGDFQLWLTRRVDDGYGFLVFARVASKNSIFLVAAIGLCVDDSMCLRAI
jgi:hypothetical protein